MREGLLESHIRKMVKCQRAKRDLLVEAIQNEFGEQVRIAGVQAGLHLLIHIRWKASEGKLIQKAREAGIALQSASIFWNNPQQQEELSFLLHYGGMRPDHIPEAVHLLKKAWS